MALAAGDEARTKQGQLLGVLVSRVSREEFPFVGVSVVLVEFSGDPGRQVERNGTEQVRTALGFAANRSTGFLGLCHRVLPLHLEGKL